MSKPVALFRYVFCYQHIDLKANMVYVAYSDPDNVSMIDGLTIKIVDRYSYPKL